MREPARRAGVWRRYPALALVGAAAVLAILLPSALNIPQSGPSSLAEFAPVPGAGAGRSDTTSLGAAGSASAGTGRGEGLGELPDGGSIGAPAQRHSRLKRCVGDPPRQTEDQLSPPCVAFFDGPNGGATHRGVTADEVSVVVEFKNVANEQRAGVVVDCDRPVDQQDVFEDEYCKGLMKYFNDRYQTYNRKIHLYAVHNNVSIADLDQRYRPFAHVAPGSSSSWAQRGVFSVGYTGTSRSNSQRNAPNLVTFRADTEDSLAQMATFVCDKLLRRTARYAGDPTIQARQRRLGLFSAEADFRRGEIRNALKEHCGLEGLPESSDWRTPVGMAQMRDAGVTTIVLVVGSTGHITATNYATNMGYFPEWFIPGNPELLGIDINFNGRSPNQVQWQNAFGITYDYRRGEFKEQGWYRAYREACPTCREPRVGEQGVTFAASMYDALSMLFYGIQAAGPRLTPANIDKGLHAIPPRPSDNPFRPAAYFSPGNYSFMKDAMSIWWDPSGTAPNAGGAGCYRLPREGRRFRAGEWPAGDVDIKASGPCQADTF